MKSTYFAGKGPVACPAAFHTVLNNTKLIDEANGISVFKDQKLVGFLTPEESKYYLFAVDKIRGGLFSFPYGEDGGEITLEISKAIQNQA